MTRTTISSAALLLCVLLLAACSEPGSNVEPTPTTSPADRTSPSPKPHPPKTVPPIPENATTKSAAGAQQFAAYYFQVYYYAKYSDDWKPLQDLSLPRCDSCALLWNGELGGHVEYAGDPKVEGESLDSLKYRGNVAVVDTDRDMPMRTWRPSSDGVIKKFEPWEFHDELKLVYRNDGWKVADIKFYIYEGPPPPKVAW